ncbi:MAG: hypothetical protein VX815_17525, partial [Gemmatimonadota bacterium]|nr:hypothetical protein [Gemmatimonadota bacterium]
PPLPRSGLLDWHVFQNHRLGSAGAVHPHGTSPITRRGSHVPPGLVLFIGYASPFIVLSPMFSQNAV